MTAACTGTRTVHGALELRRKFDLPQRELWRYLVDSEYLGQWFGTWSGEVSSGAVDVVLLAEEGTPSERVEILRCDRSACELTVRTGEGSQSWQLELAVRADGDGSELIFQMPGLEPDMAGSIGPGWEFYLDRLVAAVTGGDAGLIVFEPDYYPALSPDYEQIFHA